MTTVHAVSRKPSQLTYQTKGDTIVARDIYCRDDILNALKAVHVANGTPSDEFDRALVAVGLAFGIEPSREYSHADISDGRPTLRPPNGTDPSRLRDG
jgi:hypothetical protein